MPRVDAHTLVEHFAFLRLDSDTRRNVLSYLLSASPDAPARAIVREKELCIEEDRRPHIIGNVPVSAAAACDLLVFHRRTIKAVCAAIQQDVAVLEKTVATPNAWLEALWSCAYSKALTSGLAFKECVDRAQTAKRANLAREQLRRLNEAVRDQTDGSYGTNRYGYRTVVPSSWSDERKNRVRSLVAQTVGPGGDCLGKDEAWAHTRVVGIDEIRRHAPVDVESLKFLSRTSFELMVRKLRECRWTLLVYGAHLVYRGGFVGANPAEAATVDMPSSDMYELFQQDSARAPAVEVDPFFDQLEAGLKDFFGAETIQSEPWIQQWANKNARLSMDEYNRLFKGSRQTIRERFHDKSLHSVANGFVPNRDYHKHDRGVEN